MPGGGAAAAMRACSELLSMLDTFDFWFNIVTPVDGLPS